jgi:hypothetical protein
MKKLLLSATFTVMLVSFAEAQQVPDPRVADLVQAGKIRVGMHSKGRLDGDHSARYCSHTWSAD